MNAPTIDPARYRAQVLACWLGKAVGGTLGLPFEGQEGPLDVTFYDPVPTSVLPNDDLDLQVLWACVLDAMPEVAVDRRVLGRAWLAHVDFPWDEYGVAIRNLRNGLRPPLTGSHDNWFVDGMGAAIRSEIWACLAPGDPKLAAAYAYEDACIDHAGEGIWAEVFLASLESAAFVERDPATLLDLALGQLPQESLVRRAIVDTRRWWAELGDWRAVRERILASYGKENFTDVTMNLAFTVLAWLASGDDFGRAICIATNCGKDTDCTPATVGSLMGILRPECIDPRWLKPIGRELVVSREITGITPPATIDALADLVVDLRRRLQGRAPAAAPEPASTALPGLTVDAAFLETLPELESAAPAWPANAFRLDLAGTWGQLPAAQFGGPVLLLRFPFVLAEPTTVRVMFNTPGASRVWVDGQYAFGREGGKMGPSFHRYLLGQKADRELAAGRHEIVAAVRRPADATATVEWVVGVAKVPGLQWIANAFQPVA